MAPPLRLSYSGYNTFSECRRQYYYRYIAKPPRPDENKVNSLYGSAVGMVFEEFYKHRMPVSAESEQELLDLADPILNGLIDTPGRGNYVDFTEKTSNYKTRDDLRHDVLTSIPKALKVISDHDLVGSDSVAEDVLDVPVNQDLVMVGRADFVLTSKSHGFIILDGKGSKHREKYLSTKQLYWYAAQHQRLRGTHPEKVGFVFWRFPSDKAVDWHPVEDYDLTWIEEKAIKATKVIRSGDPKLFYASPGFRCNLCNFKDTCPEGAGFLASSSTGALDGVDT